MFSVILNTYNRADLLPRAIRSVLAQSYVDFELVVADDGSTDETPSVVGTFSDSRILYVRQVNAGLSAARNLGVASSTGSALTFLDDDDEVSSQWLQEFADLLSTPNCAVACCGVAVVGSNGRTESVEIPRDLGPPFDNCVGLFLAGTFAVRRDAFEAVGGFAEGLACSHQTELALRLVPWCTEEGFRVASVEAPHLRMHRAAAHERGRNDPARLLAGSSYILERHRERLARSPVTLSNYLSIAGVSAARSSQYPLAKAYLLQAARAHPLSIKTHARLILATVRPLGHLVWGARKGAKEIDAGAAPHRKVFLDVGAHVGETLLGALDPKYAFDDIYCFEPVAECQQALSRFADPRVTVCPFGLSNRSAELHLYNPGDIGASLFADKAIVRASSLCTFVRASDWFQQNIGKGDRVYMKLNCEGSECDVIDDLIGSRQIYRVEAMAVYWDCRKIPSQAHREQEVKARLASIGFHRHLDAKVIMRGPTYAARTQKWLDAVGADVERPLSKRVRLLRHVWLPGVTSKARGVLRVVLPQPVYSSLRATWQRCRSLT